VILFDEVEKAHSDVFNILLQVLDDGRLTDGQGHVVDFKNTIIILTSNLGSQLLSEQGEGEHTALVRDEVMEIVRHSFRPEFLNRLDEIILFHRLRREDMAHIVDVQIGLLSGSLAERKITIHLDKKARAWLAEKGFDPMYGARPLKRVIQQYLQNRLATLILEGKIKDGDELNISAGKDELQIKVGGEKQEKAA
jgi:ATP-dependent Clp protease ATP-binding subunit ClpB